MADRNSDVSKKSNANGDSVSTKVNVAFPFSQIRVEEPSAELAELAVVVRELAYLVADIAPGARSAELADRAAALATKLN